MKTILFLTLFASAALGNELMPLKDFLKAELASSKKMSKEVFKLDEAQKKEMKSLAPDSDDDTFNFFYGKTEAGKLEKACTVVPQKGKEGPLTIGVCYEPAGLITSVTILSSEEERGKKIAEKSFLSQFKGKKVSDAYQLGTDVNGISGATWSSKAVSEALRKSAFAFKTFIGGK